MDNAQALLWVTQHYPPTPGGMAQSARRQVEGLRRRGHRVDVLVLHTAASSSVVKIRERDNGREWHVSAADSTANVTQRAWHEVAVRHDGAPYDAVVGFGCSAAGHAACTFACWLRRSSVVLVRGNDFDRDWFDARRQSLVAESLSRATVIGCVTREKVEKIAALFPDAACTWTPNGIEPAFWEQFPADETRSREIRAELASDGRRVIGVFGELKYKKRIPLWLEAVRDYGLAERIGLLLVGRMTDELRQIVEDPALTPKSMMVDFQGREQLPALYGACDFVALPSLFEGFPNVLLEAMARGVVPICSNAGAMGDVVEDGRTGFVFPVEDGAAAGEATRRALELDDTALAAMKDRVREYVHTSFSVERELTCLEGLVADAIERGACNARR